MFNSYNDDDDFQERDSDSTDREISVGTTSIIAIFFILALVCAGFFGIGYLLGRRQSPQLPISAAPQPSAITATSATKPAPGSPAANGVETVPTPTDSKADTTQPLPPAPTDIPLPTKPINTPAPHAPKPTPVQSVPASLSPIVVQIAAVSHHEDADVLVAALTQRGYSVAVRQVPQDKLFHVQIGPFANRKDADAMRQRLLADGYNAIVK
jgi:DedD protein